MRREETDLTRTEKQKLARKGDKVGYSGWNQNMEEYK